MTQAHGNVQFVDTTALSDATVTATQTGTYTDKTLLATKAEYPDVARIALNAWVLDGKNPVAKAPYKFPLILGQSGADCTFSVNPMIDITFGEKHSSNGITLYFHEDLPKFTVTYKQNGTTISEKAYTANKYEFFCYVGCEGYDEILITFTKTTQPYRAVLVSYILYGSDLIFDAENIMSASLSERVDVTGATIPYNTLSIKINDSDNQLNPQNDNGAWKFIQSGQQLDAYETVDDVEVPLGTFYIDSWEYKDASATFSCVSPIGLLDKKVFGGWMSTVGYSASTLMEEIFAEGDFADYDIAEDFDTINVVGVIPRMSIRDALQQVAFAVGGVVDDSRGSTIKVYKPDRNMDSTVTRSRKFHGKSSAQLDEYINAVSITATKYIQKPDREEIYKGTISGEITIEFTEPIASPVGTNCTVTLNTPPFSITVTPTDPTQDVVVEAYRYDTSDFTITESVEAEPGQTPRTKEYSGLSVYNSALLHVLAKDLLEHHRLRQTSEMEYLCGIEKVGEWVGVEDTVEAFKTAITMIESQDINLTGGFIAKAKCRGYSTVTTPLYEMGNEELNMEEDYII